MPSNSSNTVVLDVSKCEFREPGDTAWILSSAVLVFTMQGGFALLESGCVRVNNSVNILVKNVFDFALGTVGFWAVGWGLYKGASAGGVIGTSGFFPDEDLDYAEFVFQLSFAATAATIDSGACAERMHLGVYFALSFVLSCLTYPIAAHWVWNEEGFLYQMGFVDLAGGTVVHVLGGASALMCSLMLGPRIGVLNTPIPEKLKCVQEQLALSHEVFQGEAVHVLFGTLLLFFGWIGFNSGSSMAVSNQSHIKASHIAFITVLAAAFATVVGAAVAMRWNKKGLLLPADIATSLLAGLVSITSGAHLYSAWSAMLISMVASAAAIIQSKLQPRWNIDDPVGVLPVHLTAATVGNIGIGIFAKETVCTGASGIRGIAYGGSVRQLGVQLLGWLVIFVWSSIVTAGFLAFVLYVLHREIRVDPVHEMVGNDVMEHGVDLFKRLKHTHTMQKMMAKLNKNTSHAITQSAISEASTILQAASDRGKGKSSRISPNPASSAFGEESKDGKPKRRRLTTSKSKGHGLSVLSLASNNNYEALSFVSANLKDDSVFLNRSNSEKSFKVKDASHRELLQSFKKSMGMSAATLKTQQDSKEDDGMSAAVEPRTSCNTRGSNETFESEALKSEAHARDVEETN